jgi:hypothetical protein
MKPLYAIGITVNGVPECLFSIRNHHDTPRIYKRRAYAERMVADMNARHAVYLELTGDHYSYELLQVQYA